MPKPWPKRIAAEPAEKPKPATPPAQVAESPEMRDPDELPRIGNVWFGVRNGQFFRLDERKTWISYNDSEFRRFLKYCGYQSTTAKLESISQVERVMVSVHHNRRVEYAGEIGGYRAGVHTICGSKFLVTRGPQIPQPAKGESPTIKAFVKQLLGKQWVHFYAWLKASFQSLYAGPPWRPGQALVVAGPAGCGKSLLQNLITVMLGGRSCKPYLYLSGDTVFNSNLFGAEHWMIEDEASSTDIRTRRHFGAMLKNCLVNETQQYIAKGKDALQITPFIRMTMSVNDNPESLMVLPPLDEDISDKLILLKADVAAIAREARNPEERKAFWSRLVSEVPSFLFQLGKWKVPESIADPRYGVKAWQSPDLVRAVDQLSPESRLLNLIDTYLWTDVRNAFEGTAFQLEQELRERDKGQGEVSRLLSYNSACGTYLARLAKKEPRVEVSERRGNQNVYLIAKKNQE